VLASVADLSEARIHRQMLPDANVALKSSILWLRDHAILTLFLLIGSATA